MQGVLPILFASVAGMGHAFEPDHLLAVDNLISRRDTLAEALHDGMYWGLGHTITLVAVGSFMLVVMGFSRLLEQHRPSARVRPGATPSRAAYAVSLLHGLAGSGALVLLVLLVMSEIRSPWLSVLYFAVFGVGSILGIFIVAGLCNVPSTKRMRISRVLKFSAVALSSLLCSGYGGWMIYRNVRW